MKKYLITIVAVFLTISYAAIDAEACCPDPSYTQYTVSTKYPGSSCDMDIVFCYKQMPTGDRSFKLCQINFDAITCTGVNVVFDATFWEFVDQAMITEMDSHYPFGPCPFSGGSTNLISEITKASCLEVVDDPVNQTSNLVPCGTGSADCVSYYKVCKKEGGFDIELDSGPYKQGIDACPPPGEDPANIFIIGCFSICE